MFAGVKVFDRQPHPACQHRCTDTKPLTLKSNAIADQFIDFVGL